MKINVTLKSFGNNEKYRGRATVVRRHRRCFLVRITIPLEIIDCRREIIDGSFLQNKGKTAYSRGLPLSKTAFTSNRRQLRRQNATMQRVLLGFALYTMLQFMNKNPSHDFVSFQTRNFAEYRKNMKV